MSSNFMCVNFMSGIFMSVFFSQSARIPMTLSEFEGLLLLLRVTKCVARSLCICRASSLLTGRGVLTVLETLTSPIYRRFVGGNISNLLVRAFMQY